MQTKMIKHCIDSMYISNQNVKWWNLTGLWEQFRDLCSQDITSHTCSFQDYIVLFWFFFLILGQDETSSWGIWKNSFDSNKHKFQLLYCLLWAASLEFWINSSFHVPWKLICCTFLWQWLWFCYYNCQNKMIVFLLYPVLFDDRAIALSRGIWAHYATKDFTIEHVTCVCFLAASLLKGEKASF